MEDSNLTQLEIRNLISLYQSELRKLHYQFLKTQNTIDELEDQLAETASTQVPGSIYKGSTIKKKRGPGRPPKKKKRGPGRPPKKKKRGPGRPPKKRGPGRPPKKSSNKRTRNVEGGYRLSDWDKFLIRTIQKANEPLINKEIFAEAKKEYTDEDPDEIKGKISRTIHKLANKRDVLVKHDYEGRGYAYTVNPNADWE